MDNDRNDTSTWRCPYCDALNDKDDMVCQVCGDGRREDVYAPTSGEGAPVTESTGSSRGWQTGAERESAAPRATAAVKENAAPRAAAASERYETAAPARPKKKLGAGGWSLLLIAGIMVAGVAGYKYSDREKPVPKETVADGRTDNASQTEVYKETRSRAGNSGFVVGGEGQNETTGEMTTGAAAAGSGGAVSRDAVLQNAVSQDAVSKEVASESAGPRVYTDIGVIWEVQNALNAESYNCGTPDGIAGQKTKDAITLYKTGMGLDDTSPDITDELLECLGIEMSEVDIKYHTANLQAAMSSLWYCRDEGRGIMLSCFTNKDETYGGFFYQKSKPDGSTSVNWMVGPIAVGDNQVVMEEDGCSITFRFDNGNVCIQENQGMIDDDATDLVLTPHNTDGDREMVISVLKAWVDFEYGE